MEILPPLMILNNGTPVQTAADMSLRRKELIKILEENAYGIYPLAVPADGTVVNVNEKCCSGNAKEYTYDIACSFDNGTFHYPMKLFMPNAEGKKPLIIVINFRPSPYDEYIPVEEIVDHGFALAHIFYGDVTSDDGDFSNGVAAYFPRGTAVSSGKIGMWAWSISRALDVLLKNPEIDEETVGVIGHSRLGKTALWCGANDERIGFICSNDSGCMGAAYARTYHEDRETVSRIAVVFPFWFCEKLQRYKDNVDAMPFDQHFLLAAAAPRRVFVNSASKDLWADPISEQNSCIAASPAWSAYGKTGYAGHTEPYGINEGCFEGEVGYYKRYGIHFLGRKDWLNFMEFIKKAHR